MADIKSSVLFQKRKNNPLDKIKAQNQQKQEEQKVKQRITSQDNSIHHGDNPSGNKKTEEIKNKKVKSIDTVKKTRHSSVGAPDKFLDKAFKVSQSVKLSAISNSTLRLLTEKYSTDKTKDEIIREALTEYIVTHLEKEERSLLLKDLEKELSLFREKEQNKTITLTDIEGNIIKSAEEIEKETIEGFREGFKLK